LDTWSSSGSVPQEMTTNWNRNQMLVDLSYIPNEYEQAILQEYNKPVTADRSKIFNYFVEKGLKNLMNDIQDF
jgi:sulfatase maturation enzyme AslB (radical SAM superfamily)